MGSYDCISDPYKILVLGDGERKLSITHDEEVRLLTRLKKTPAAEQWDVVYIQIAKWVKDSDTDEGQYYARQYTNDFFARHGMYNQNRSSSPDPQSCSAALQESREKRERKAAVTKLIGAMLLHIIGGSVLFGGGVWICDQADGNYLVVVLGVFVSFIGLFLVGRLFGWWDNIGK